MPKVSKFRTKIEREWTYLDIMFTPKKGFYFKDWPEKVGQVVGYPDGSNTLTELEGRAYVLIRKYHQEITKIDRVIRYKIAFSRGLSMKQHKINQASGIDNIFREFPRSEFTSSFTAVGIEVDYKIYNRKLSETVEYQEVFINDQGIEELGNFTLERFQPNDQWKTMPYTEERHQFFIHAQKAIKNLSKMVAEYFNPEQNLIEKIDNHKKLLS